MESSSSTTQTGASILFMACLLGGRVTGTKSEKALCVGSLPLRTSYHSPLAHERQILLLPRKGQADRIQQGIFAERLEQAVNRAFGHHPGDHILIPMGGNENNRDAAPIGSSASAAVRVRSFPAFGRPESGIWFWREPRNPESLRPKKTPHCIAQGLEQPFKGFAERFIVVHHGDWRNIVHREKIRPQNTFIPAPNL